MDLSLEVRDLRQYTGKQLQPLLQQEGHVWRERLLWDYMPSIELLLRYLDARILPGLVAIDMATSQIVGYCFSVYEGQKAVIGDVFAIPGPHALQIEETLLTSLIETLQNTPGVDRIESQLLLHDAGRHTRVFSQTGFVAYPRVFMETDLLAGPLLATLTPALPEGLRVVHWTTSHFQLAGELIHRAYQNHGDAVINDQYHSIHGSLRFLHNIVRFPGCGIFDAESSCVVWDNKTSTMEGLILCSTVLKDVAHITQICVAPQHRGNRVGKTLLYCAAKDLAHRGYRSITLTVTEANQPAMRLYQSLGFQPRTRFDAMMWQRD